LVVVVRVANRREKAQRVIALFHDSRPDQRIEFLRKRKTNRMLHNHECRRIRPQHFHRSGILRFERIGRIQKHNVGFEGSEMQRRRSLDDAPFTANAERLQVGLDGFDRLPVALDEHRMLRPAADRFNPDGARPRIGVHEDAALDARRKNVEQCLAQPIRSRPHIESGQR